MKSFLCMSDVAVLVNFYLLFSFIMPFYTTEVLGVNEGDWASYKVVSAWHSDIPDDTIPQHIIDINETEWRLEVEKVLGEESVRLSVTINYSNGTKKREIHEGNLWTGSGNLSMWVVRKNLETGSLVHEEKELKVNATQSLESAGTVRQTVYAWFRQEEADGNTWSYALFWDRETGILCGEIISTVRTVETHISTVAVRINIVDTSLWEPSNDNFWFLVLGGIILVLALAISVFVWTRGKSRRRKTRKR
jgi:hypothetical protein